MPYSDPSSSIHQFNQNKRLPGCVLPTRMEQSYYKESRVFNKLTDHRMYTGSSKNRFDSEGYGVPTYSEKTKYSGGRVLDLSQITRMNLNASGRTSIGFGNDEYDWQYRGESFRDEEPLIDEMILVDNHPLLQPQPPIFEKLTTEHLYTGSHRIKAGYAPVISTREYPDIPPSSGRHHWSEGLRQRPKKAKLQQREQNWR